MSNLSSNNLYPDSNLQMVSMTEADFADYGVIDATADTLVELNGGDLRGLYILRASGEKIPIVNLYVNNNHQVRMEGHNRIYADPGAQADWDYRYLFDLYEANDLLENLAPKESLHVLMFPIDMMWKIVFEKNDDNTISMYGYILPPVEYDDEDEYEPDDVPICDNPNCSCNRLP